MADGQVVIAQPNAALSTATEQTEEQKLAAAARRYLRQADLPPTCVSEKVAALLAANPPKPRRQ